MYKYFVSYNASYEQRMSFGHTEITTVRKITGIKEIQSLAKDIERTFNHPEGSVIILNFKRFDD